MTAPNQSKPWLAYVTSDPFDGAVADDTLRAKTLGQFLDERPVIDFLIDDCLRRGWLYTCTAQPGAGKTGYGVRVSLDVVLGEKLAQFQCQPAPVLFIAAENPDDVNMRFRLAIERMAEERRPWARNNIHVLDRSFTLAGRQSELLSIVEGCKAGLVVVDTDQAISLGDGSAEVDNDGRMAHAKRLRELTRCSSRPTVLDFCHPNAQAGPDALRPRGGSALLAEVDGNLQLFREESVVTVRTDAGKFRGEPFEQVFRSTLQKSPTLENRLLTQ